MHWKIEKFLRHKDKSLCNILTSRPICPFIFICSKYTICSSGELIYEFEIVIEQIHLKVFHFKIFICHSNMDSVSAVPHVPRSPSIVCANNIIFSPAVINRKEMKTNFFISNQMNNE